MGKSKKDLVQIYVLLPFSNIALESMVGAEVRAISLP